MTVVFMGTPAFAVPSLKALLASRHKVAGVFTQPDRPAGRGLGVRLSAVKEAALEAGLAVAQPAKVRGAELPAALERIAAFGADVLVVVAYGQILPRALLEAAAFGGVNLHASLLPRWRGAAPIARAIAEGDPLTGVTTMKMTEKLDAGDILLQRSTSIGAEETAGDLEKRLAAMGAPLLVETLDAMQAGTLGVIPQNEGAVTMAPMLTKEEGRIDWSAPATVIARRVRAFDPWPVAHTRARGRGVQIWRSRPAADAGATSGTGRRPGEVLAAGAAGVRVACGGGSALDLLEVQPEGKRRMTASEAAAGRYFGAGDLLDAAAA